MPSRRIKLNMALFKEQEASEQLTDAIIREVKARPHTIKQLTEAYTILRKKESVRLRS